jgi:hypothetical protein
VSARVSAPRTLRGERLRTLRWPLRWPLLLPALVLAAVLLAPCAQAPAAEPAAGAEVVRMTFLPLAGGAAPLYLGTRSLQTENGRVTVRSTYTTPAGAEVQRTEGVYDAATLEPLGYHLLDARSGQEETLSREGGSVKLSYRAKAGAGTDSDTVKLAPDQHFTPTVEPLILREWARLAAGETVPFRLLVPSRQDVYQFRLMREDSPAMARPGHLVVRMEPGTWFVRQLVDPLFFWLEEAPPHRLMEFRGRVSIKTDGGDDQDLRIVYTYPGQG